MAKRDYYEILGVSKGVSGDELKKAFRKKAMQFHPDRNPDDPEAEVKFKEVGEAYDVLKDDQKRAAYDQYGHAAFEGGGPGGGHPGGGFDFGSFSDVFEDLFGDFMGGGGGRRGGGNRAQRGADLRYNMEITLDEAFAGKDTTITVPSTAECGSCDGSGAEPGSSPEVCPTCHGHGKVRAQQGFFMVERTCNQCRGQGQVISSPCKSCDGVGRIEKEKTLSVKIPAGVEDGMRIRLAGEGEAGYRGGPAGDLYIFISIEEHDIFQRDGAMVYLSMPLPMTTAILGGEIEVPTIDGKRAKLKIPDGTQTHSQFRLRGKGMPEVSSQLVGDMIVEVRLETPVNLTKKQKQLVEEFADVKANNSPNSKGFFSRVKEMFS